MPHLRCSDDIETPEDENGFRHAATRHSDAHDAVFDLCARLWVDAGTQPIEDTSVEWPVWATGFAARWMPEQVGHDEQA